MGVKCFMVHETDRFRARLRRFTYGSKAKCAGRPQCGHDASSDVIEIIKGVKDPEGGLARFRWQGGAHAAEGRPALAEEVRGM
jgi:hypothetical protein